MENTPYIILGIDPGTLMMGFGLIQVQGLQPRLLEMGVLKLAGKKDPYLRLRLIHEKVLELIHTHKPSSFAVEAPFFGKNVQSMLKLGRAQGVAIASAIQAGISVTEYSPRKIKQSIAGNGNATKEQVWLMLQRICAFRERPDYFDATDALAVAVCHFFQQGTVPKIPNTEIRSWKDFALKNPEKIARPL